MPCCPREEYATNPAAISRPQLDFINLMHKLWEEHVAWTRMTIISIAEDLADQGLVTKRLLRNPADIAAALRPLYGEEAASRFESLVTDHLVIAAELVKAAKAGDTAAAAADAEKRWYANADEIVTFLNSINPYWTREAMTEMWHRHLALTKAEAVARLNKDYATDIALYDQIQEQILAMADLFAAGIFAQFPMVFRT